MKFLNFRGIYPQTVKNTIGIDITPLRPMEFYNVPCKLKNIAESVPVVGVGDEVKKGTLIAKPSGNFGINIFSPISGKVLNIVDKIDITGEPSKHILIMNNNRNEVEDLHELEAQNMVHLTARLKECGMVDTLSGLPTYLKYAYTGSRAYSNIFVLMDSTDPNNTVSQTLAEFKMEEVVNGAKYFMNITNATYITFIFTEKNRALAEKLKKHIAANKKNYDYKIKFIPNKYPFDNSYLLAYLVGKKKITGKTSFLDAGISIETAESCYNFCRAVEFNKPVTSKIVTIDGDNVIRKGNYSVQNGVSYESLLDFIGVEDKNCTSMFIDGNLLNGTAQYNTDISVSLFTDTLMYMKYEKPTNVEEYPCISCGKCAGVCPVLLNPQRIDRAYLAEDHDELAKLNIQSCIECGCCSYVCPSKRFLKQRIAAAKFYERNKIYNKKNKRGKKKWANLSFQVHHLFIAKMM